MDKRSLNSIKRKYDGMDYYELDDLEGLREDVRECITDCSSLFLADVNDKDAFVCMSDIIDTLHYSNGIPLNNPDGDYFDHYDRDFWGYFIDEPLYFDLNDAGELICRINLTYDELRTDLTMTYDGDDYEQDYGYDIVKFIDTHKFVEGSIVDVDYFDGYNQYVFRVSDNRLHKVSDEDDTVSLSFLNSNPTRWKRIK